MTEQLFDLETLAAPVYPPVAGVAGQIPARHGAGEEGAASSPAGEAGRTTGAAPVLVIGVDLSLTSTGVASRHGARSITSSGTADATLSQRQQRLRHLRQRIVAAITQHGDPDLIVIEAPAYSRTTGSQHDRSGLWWLLIDVFTIRGWQVIEATPTTRMKYATGKGRADKDVVLAAAIKRLPIDVTNGDEADAAWLCAIGHDLLERPLVEVPQTHRAALDVLRPQLTTARKS